MRYCFWILLITASVALIGCDAENENDFVEEVVVEGTMYVGHPLQIDLSRTVPMDRYYDPDEVNISGADISIWADGREFHLIEELPEVPGRYSLPADSHIIESGVRYDLEVIVDSTIITATTVAAAPLRIQLCSLENFHDSTNADVVEYGGEYIFFVWDFNPVDFGYFILIENTEPNWSNLEIDEENGSSNSNVSAWTMRDDSVFVIPWTLLNFKGTHRVRIYACEQALWDYSNTTFLGEPDNYPVTNLSSGKGVFCAVGADTAYFELINEIED